MYVIKLYYLKKNDMEDIILCSADTNNVNKMFHTCVVEIQKHLAFKFVINKLEAVIKVEDLYIKIYAEEVNKKFKETDIIKDVILKAKSS